VIDVLINMNMKLVLIVCPKSVVDVWPAQFAQHSARPFTVCALTNGSTAQRARAAKQAVELAAARHAAIAVIINYEASWMGELGTWITTQDWDAVICDESHRIKQPGGKAALFFSRLGDKVPVRLCLTGTPLPHSPLDAYSQYRFLDKGIFGTSFTLFRNRYAITQQIGANINAKKVIGFQNQQELHDKMYSIAFRVKAEDVQDLPEIVDVVRTVQLSREARRVYEELKREFVTDFKNGQITAGNALTRLLRLQQIASGWVKYDDNIELGTPGALVRVDHEKEKLLEDILEDLSADEPVIIFCRFRHDLQTVHEVSKRLKRGSLELSGSANQLAEWQAGAAPILATQIQSGGVGVDLTRARYCVFFSLGFSLGEYLQARKRAHRPGQTRAVTIIHVIASKTVDQDVYTALENREAVVEAILNQTAKGSDRLNISKES
jgi:SNF2 family DNA or RNA helicase